jgi:hypothetical protein
MAEKKSARVLGIRVGIRLTNEEQRMLDELTKRYYPETERASSMMIRRLIRQEYKRITDEETVQQS